MSNTQEIDYFCLEAAVFPPNKPLEPRASFSKVPVVYDSIFFLDFNESGNCIVGASEVAGTFWEGTLLYFKDDKHMENYDYSGHYIFTTASDGKFVNKTTIAIAEDTGNITILSLDQDSTIRPVNYFKVAEQIPQISVWKNCSRILSCSARSLAIWEAESIDRKPVEKYENIHIEKITCVDTLNDDTNLFLSGARDRMACVWDLRSPIPSSVLYTNEFSSISSISWNQYDENYVAIGTQAGDVYLIDKRQPNDFISVFHCFNANINRISFKNVKEFAVCGDVNDVLILNCEDSSLVEIYRNTEHTGHVKDLKWYKETLYSCGFGKCLVNHLRNQKPKM